MLRVAVFALVVVATFAASIAPNDAVGGIVSCGSQGEVLEVRVTDCKSLPCDLTIGKTYTVEVDFIPFAEHRSLHVFVAIVADGNEEEIVDFNLPTYVIPGYGYTVAYPLTVTGWFAKGNVDLKIKVSDNGVTELCGLASVFIHE